jgi:hypothetical protein
MPPSERHSTSPLRHRNQVITSDLTKSPSGDLTLTYVVPDVISPRFSAASLTMTILPEVMASWSERGQQEHHRNMPSSVKPASRAVRAAIGELVIEVTWIQYQAARLVMFAGITADGEDEASLLLMPARDLFRRARQGAGKLTDTAVADRTRSWLREAEELARRRNEFVHSVVLHTGQRGLSLYHPKTRHALAPSTREITALAARASKHADEGARLSLFDWPGALGLAEQESDASD